MTPFGSRLQAAMERFGPLAVGIDPHPGLLERWELADDIDGLRRFCLGVVEAVGGRVAALKPQSALFERHGSAGVAVLEEVIAAAKAVDTLVIVDAKRGDIGSTMAGYADAYLRDGSPLAADAVTLSPYLGFGSLRPAIDQAISTGRGVFVLGLTSNPDGAQVQHSRDEDGLAVATRIAVEAARVNHDVVGPGELGPVGLVIGATVGDAPKKLGMDLEDVRGAFLAPGFGAQGAGSAELRTVFAQARGSVLVASSRAVLAAGPSRNHLQEVALRAAEDARIALHG